MLNSQVREPSRNFGHLCRLLAAARGDRGLAAARADQQRASEAVRIVLRSAVPAQAISDVFTDTSAESLAPFAALATQFLESLVSFGAFDRIAAAAVQLPFRQRLAVGTGVMAATVVDEGKPSAMQALRLSDLGDQMKPLKTMAMTAITTELAKVAETAAVVERELRTGLALGSDLRFCSDLAAATTPIPSTGMYADVTALIAAVPLRANSRPFLVFEADAVKALATARLNGEKVYPDLDVLGGTIDGIPVVPSDGLVSGTALLADAQGLAANRGTAGVSVSQQGSVELESAPSQDATASAGVQLVSAWQSGLSLVKVERTFAYTLMRSSAVASLSGIAWS